jgi:hypothetical protein
MNEQPFRYLDGVVFPSEERTIAVQTNDTYGGAHKYYFTNCIGHKDGKTTYTPGEGQIIQFIEKPADGSPVIPGVQSEQLIVALIDRHQRLNEKFPSPFNDLMIRNLEGALAASKARVEDRLERDVMGKLAK